MGRKKSIPIPPPPNPGLVTYKLKYVFVGGYNEEEHYYVQCFIYRHGILFEKPMYSFPSRAKGKAWVQKETTRLLASIETNPHVQSVQVIGLCENKRD